AYHLFWDGEVVYQSQRHGLYQAQIDQWVADNQAYYCQCTRKQIKALGGFYNGHCRNAGLIDSGEQAVRLCMDFPVESFDDVRHDTIQIPKALAEEDFIIKRRDGLFAYNLAVVLDDIDQGVTEVVRGADLIEPTGRQISLYKTLKQKTVSYLHLPLATDGLGNKLSKQNHATAIDLDNPKPTLLNAMRFLGFEIPTALCEASMDEILLWGCQQWNVSQLPDSLQKEHCN
ncbi:tRNA glutamyl-Q(34) synthetase GluQRS, partial [Vibrio sp. 10N.261.45.A7]